MEDVKGTDRFDRVPEVVEIQLQTGNLQKVRDGGGGKRSSRSGFEDAVLEGMGCRTPRGSGKG